MKKDPTIWKFIDEQTGEVRFLLREGDSPPLPPWPSFRPAPRSKTKSNPVQIVRMVGFLFARPDSPLAKKEIIPSLEYFHERSGEHIDFYCPGYESFHANKPSALNKKHVVRVGDEDTWIFSVKKFNSSRKKIESMTKWRYSGGVDLVLLNAKQREKQEMELDFSGAIAINLDEAKADKAIKSIETFFEKIFQYAESQSGLDPTWGFSDHLGLKIVKSVLKGVALSALPKSVSAEATKAFHFTVKDISRD